MKRILSVVIVLAGCASSPVDPVESAPEMTWPMIKVLDHDCMGTRVHRILLQITPGNQPNQAILTVTPKACADAI